MVMIFKSIRRGALMVALSWLFALTASADGASDPGQLAAQLEKLSSAQEKILEAVDDIQWFNRLGDIAYVDKVWLYSSPARGKKNKLKFMSHIFVPKAPKADKIPLMVFVHGGLNGAFQTKYAHIMRELVVQGYAVIAPEYRGSRGFGEKFKQANDRGGRELDDIRMARNFMVDAFPAIDKERVGIMGWSMGGFIAGMSAMTHPEDYAAAFSGNPVSNLKMRMGYRNKEYNAEFTRMFGKSVKVDPQTYLDRSPAGNAGKLAVPYLIHTTTSDRVVRVDEVMTLVEALKKAGKDFEYKVYENAPGDHSFERLFTPLAREARIEVYGFMARYLKPENAFSRPQDIVQSWVLH